MNLVQSAGAVECIESISAEGLYIPMGLLYMTRNNLMVKLQ